MTVRAILDLKGRDVATITPAATLADAARLLSERHIGAVVVTGADARVIGILSERDIVRALSARGSGALA
jgi:CBS domain-containing protein